MEKIADIVSGTESPITYIANLPKPDGLVHSMLIKYFGRFGTDDIDGVDRKVNRMLDGHLTLLQKQGYTIIDVKLSTFQGAGMTGQSIAYHVLVLYK